MLKNGIKEQGMNYIKNITPVCLQASTPDSSPTDGLFFVLSKIIVSDNICVLVNSFISNQNLILMKRFIFVLAMLLIGFAGMAAEKADCKQINAPPGDACLNLVVEISQVAAVNAQVDFVVVYAFSAVAYPVEVFETSPAELTVKGDVIKPPGMIATSYSTPNYIKDYSCHNRAWLLHRKSLDRKINFLEPTVRKLPVPFD